MRVPRRLNEEVSWVAASVEYLLYARELEAAREPFAEAASRSASGQPDGIRSTVDHAEPEPTRKA